MRIAILGAGFCGLASAYHLLQQCSCEIDIYDPVPIGKGTSGIAAGLLHPFVGVHAKLNWRGREGFEATLNLLHVAEKALGSPVIIGYQMLRLAINEKQEMDFRNCASLHHDVRWLDSIECQQICPNLAPYPGIFIETALSIDCEKYLKGLSLACKEKGAAFFNYAVTKLEELYAYDLIVIAMGAASTTIPELSHFKLRSVKGQILELEWPEGLSYPKVPVNSLTYLVANEARQRAVVGATFEKHFATSEPNLQIAQDEIMSKTAVFMPSLADAKIIGCRAGIRAITPDKRPLLKQINERCWLISGMGSKGLLYHALYAEELARRTT